MEEHLPTVDLSLLRHNAQSKALAIEEIGEACRKYGIFNVINHGIPDSVIEEALNVNSIFFEMGLQEKEELSPDGIYKDVRYGRVEIGDLSRDFLKLYAHPLDQYVDHWPSFPSSYRKKMGVYTTEARKVCIELFGAIVESLRVDNAPHLKEKFEHGFQILGINCYNPCSGSNMKTGTPPHTDHSIITLLLQSSPGLQVINDGTWKIVPELKGSLQVLVGDHLEVISNGLYRSVLHRAIPGDCNTRFSIANFNSLAMDEIVEPAATAESEENGMRYKGSSLRDFLKHRASMNKRDFIDTLKISQMDT